jgi:hypothetical protein
MADLSPLFPVPQLSQARRSRAPLSSQLIRGARLTLLLVLLGGLAPSGARVASAQGDVEPLQCWWRTSVSAVRVGEPFTLVVTCAELQTDALTAVVDRARLDPRVIELPPFEVIGGEPAPDLQSGDRTFFQYQYTLRFINEAFFNEDVPLPALTVPYRIQSRVAGQDASTQGIERRFALPHQMMRITSLVPSDAADIRDATAMTFAEVDRSSTRARTLVTTGMIVTALGGLLALIGLGRLIGQRLALPVAASGLVSDTAVLRGVSRELSAVRRDRNDTGWTVPLVARALAASRIVAEYALSRPASQLPATPRLSAPAGTLVLPRRFGQDAAVLVSGSVTPKTIALALIERAGDGHLAPARLEELKDTLTEFTRAEYAEAGTLEETALDQSLSRVEQLARRLAVEHNWLMRRLTPIFRLRAR